MRHQCPACRRVSRTNPSARAIFSFWTICVSWVAVIRISGIISIFAANVNDLDLGSINP
jgi:hypothetical protein